MTNEWEINLPRKKNEITIVMAYYENGQMLQRHLKEWKSYPFAFKSLLKVIIVDDGSTFDPAWDNMTIDPGFPVRLFRIKQDIPWNQNGARNLGMHHAEGWCLLTDMDHLLPTTCVGSMVNMKLKRDYAYRPLRTKVDGSDYKRHPNTYLIHQGMYADLGGYDESYAGYYGTDSTFRRRLCDTTKLIDTDAFHVVLYGREDIPDASTDPDQYGRKDTEYHVSRNPELAARKKLCPAPIKPLNFDWEELPL